MEIIKAKKEDAEEVLKIYKSLVGTKGCLWDEYYPAIEDVEEDIKKDGLYIVLDNKKIIAAAYAGKDEELEKLTCWDKEIKNPCGLSRLGVLKECQSKGIAKKLLTYVEKDALNRGYDGICFIVGKTNFSAVGLYNRMNYICCGETKDDFLNIDWLCYEKKLK